MVYCNFIVDISLILEPKINQLIADKTPSIPPIRLP